MERGVFPNEQGPLAAGDELAAYHVRPVEARQLHTPYLWSLSDDQSHSLLRAAGSCGSCRRTHHVVAEIVGTIRLVKDLGFCQNHHIVIAKLDRPNGLGKDKYPAIADVVRPEV